MPKTPLYAAITLGSNSFNMLVAKTLGGRPHIIAKYKRKVRLADGILYNGSLSEEVLLRGLDCLFMFSHMLKNTQSLLTRLLLLQLQRSEISPTQMTSVSVRSPF